MRAALSALALLLLAGDARAELRIEGRAAASPYTLVRLSAAGAAPKAGLVWRVSPRTGVDRATTARGRLEFTAPPGTYEVDLTAVILQDGETVVEEATLTVVIGGPAPLPPPQPPPQPPPTPDDPFVADLRAAYRADMGPDRAADLADLATLYRTAGPTVDNPRFTTWGEVVALMGANRKVLLADTALLGVRKRIEVELGKTLPTTNDPLTPELRTRAKAAFAQVAAALKEAGK